MKANVQLRKNVWSVLQQIELFSQLQQTTEDIGYYLESHGNLPSPSTQADILDILAKDGAIEIGEDICARHSEGLPPVDANIRYGVRITKLSGYGKYYRVFAEQFGDAREHKNKLSLSLDDNRLTIGAEGKEYQIKTFQDGGNGVMLFRYIFNSQLNTDVSFALLAKNDINLKGVSNFSQFINSLKLKLLLKPFLEVRKGSIKLSDTAYLDEEDYQEYLRLIRKEK